MFISLIPKIPYTAEIFHFILISQWFESKKLSKVIMDHLKVVMPLIINSNQNAFVEGRQIPDDVLLAMSLFAIGRR